MGGNNVGKVCRYPSWVLYLPNILSEADLSHGDSVSSSEKSFSHHLWNLSFRLTLGDNC